MSGWQLYVSYYVITLLVSILDNIIHLGVCFRHYIYRFSAVSSKVGLLWVTHSSLSKKILDNYTMKCATPGLYSSDRSNIR